VPPSAWATTRSTTAVTDRHATRNRRHGAVRGHPGAGVLEGPSEPAGRSGPTARLPPPPRGGDSAPSEPPTRGAPSSHRDRAIATGDAPNPGHTGRDGGQRGQECSARCTRRTFTNTVSSPRSPTRCTDSMKVRSTPTTRFHTLCSDTPCDLQALGLLDSPETYEPHGVSSRMAVSQDPLERQ
jgi:hypothetical protein